MAWWIFMPRRPRRRSVGGTARAAATGGRRARGHASVTDQRREAETVAVELSLAGAVRQLRRSWCLEIVLEIRLAALPPGPLRTQPSHLTMGRRGVPYPIL